MILRVIFQLTVLYLALLGDVIARSLHGLAAPPSLLLLFAFAFARTRGGVVWSAVAGLICDGLAGRPLGVTMLTAVLATTVLREASRNVQDHLVWRGIKVFCFVTIVECSARVVTSTVVSAAGIESPLVKGLQISGTSTAVFVFGALAMQFAGRAFARSRRSIPDSLVAGRVR